MSRYWLAGWRPISFNTQPPEGGWVRQYPGIVRNGSFNTQPPEGGWGLFAPIDGWTPEFQHTAARRRLEAAGFVFHLPFRFNTQPPEGGWADHQYLFALHHVSTHSRPKAAGPLSPSAKVGFMTFQHTAARRRLAVTLRLIHALQWFQHTAARRRLEDTSAGIFNLSTFQHTAARRRLGADMVCCSLGSGFQHTAARRRLGGIRLGLLINRRFNTQPPEGGWPLHQQQHGRVHLCFNTQPPEGGWPKSIPTHAQRVRFQHTAARRRLDVPRESIKFHEGFQHTAARRRLALLKVSLSLPTISFNTQPPEGGWGMLVNVPSNYDPVSTHSRPKAAGQAAPVSGYRDESFNTQPPEGGWSDLTSTTDETDVSTHSRPKAAGP